MYITAPSGLVVAHSIAVCENAGLNPPMGYVVVCLYNEHFYCGVKVHSTSVRNLLKRRKTQRL